MKTLLTLAVIFSTESLPDRIFSKEVGIRALGSLSTYGMTEVVGGFIPSMTLRTGLRREFDRGISR